MMISHSHIVFKNGHSVPYSEIKNSDDVNALIVKIRAEEPYGENRQEVLTRLNNLLDFFDGGIVFACNANHSYPNLKPEYRNAFIFRNGEIVRINHDGDTNDPFGLSPMDLTIYTPLRLDSWANHAPRKLDSWANHAPRKNEDSKHAVHRNETFEIIFEHGGRQYRADDPRAAINAMLSVASGKNSKNLAWSLAYQAVEQCRIYFPFIADDLKKSLGNGRYPEMVTI